MNSERIPWPGLQPGPTTAGQDARCTNRCVSRHGGVPVVLMLLWLACGAGGVGAQDTPEMLAAMRAYLPSIPEQVPEFEALPAEFRRQVPPFRVEVHRWHADPAQRFVQIDGRRVMEDGVAGQELWLRQIRADAVVMQFRDRIFVQALTHGE
jgi:hypothetical protein